MKAPIHGHISKQVPPVLRWLLPQAAWVAIRCDPNARRIYARIAKGAENKKESRHRPGPQTPPLRLERLLPGHPFVWPNTEIQPGNVP